MALQGLEAAHRIGVTHLSVNQHLGDYDLRGWSLVFLPDHTGTTGGLLLALGQRLLA